MGAVAGSSPVWAQGLGNSPYSALGLGEEYTSANVTNMGMGGLGISNASPFFLNSQNPALLARRTRFTIFEVGVLGQSRSVAQGNQSQKSFGANLGYLALAFPLSSRWNSSISLRPYSYVDYQTSQTSAVAGSNYSSAYLYSGKGAINRASFSNGVRLTKNVYVGAEASFLFGNITNNATAQVVSNGSGSLELLNIDHISYRNIIYRLGVAWRPKLSEKWVMNVGATYDPQRRVSARQTNSYQQVLGGAAVPVPPDTLQSNQRGSVTLPQQAHFGISLEQVNKLLIGVDVGYQQWSQFTAVSTQSARLKNSMNVAVGFEYTPKSNSSSYWQLVTYRAGAQYTQTPYVILKNQPSDVSGSLGVSLPMGAYYVNHLNLAIVAGQRGVLGGEQIRERYVKLALGVSLNDWWFRKAVVD